MKKSDKQKIKELFFKLKDTCDSSPLVKKEIITALRIQNVLSSNTLENDFIDSIFLDSALYRGNIRVKEFSNPVYRKCFLEVKDCDRMLRYLEVRASKKAELSVTLLLKLHRIIFENSWPDIAGQFRNVDVRIRGIKQRLPHYTQIKEIIYQHVGWVDGILKLLGPVTPNNFYEIFHIAADLQRRIIHTYPFQAGNWRIARAMSDYILLYSGMTYNIIGASDYDNYISTIGNSKITDFSDFEEFLLGCYGETLNRVIGFTKLKNKF
ncbi:MAG: Fic family protein [candidate division Zixibacteria bacterium]|nr:Fic family protein [candidate division Zixibacteria bacterium]